MHTLDVPGSGPSQHLGLEVGPALGEVGTGSPQPHGGHGGDSSCGQSTQKPESKRAGGLAAWDWFLAAGG